VRTSTILAPEEEDSCCLEKITPINGGAGKARNLLAFLEERLKGDSPPDRSSRGAHKHRPESGGERRRSRRSHRGREGWILSDSP